MRKSKINIHVPSKFNKELSEDLRHLQQKLRGGVSVYKNRVSTYRRRPKHPKDFQFAYELEPYSQQLLRRRRERA